MPGTLSHNHFPTGPIRALLFFSLHLVVKWSSFGWANLVCRMCLNKRLHLIVNFSLFDVT